MPSVDLPQGTIHFREEGDGEPIVLVHGLLLDGRVWDEVVPLLRDRFRVLVPDLPFGCHRTAMRPEADLSPWGAARLIADFAEALDLRDYTLVGNDTGGAYAHVSATQHPARVGRLVLSSCDLEDNFLPPMFQPLRALARVPGSSRLLGETLRFRAVQRLPNAFGWLSHKPLDPALIASMTEPLRRDAGVRRDLAKLLRGVDAAATVQAAKDLASFDRPTLWAWGGDDRFFGVDHANRLARTMPDARFEVIPNSRTYTPVDQPERLAALIVEFAG